MNYYSQSDEVDRLEAWMHLQVPGAAAVGNNGSHGIYRLFSGCQDLYLVEKSLGVT